jgi:hypothetical protein
VDERGGEPIGAAPKALPAETGSVGGKKRLQGDGVEPQDIG